jgi:hypothetical protein
VRYEEHKMSRKMDWEKASARERGKPERKGPMPVAWWWTVSTNGWQKCDECNVRIKRFGLYAWNHNERKALCEVCGESHYPQMSKKALAYSSIRQKLVDGQRTK